MRFLDGVSEGAGEALGRQEEAELLRSGSKSPQRPVASQGDKALCVVDGAESTGYFPQLPQT